MIATPSAADTAKRSFDIVVGGLLCVLTLPIQALLVPVVRLHLGSPVLFRQRRAGLHSQPFTLVKFRTMLPVDRAHGLVDDRDRLTPFGRFLRATSLDELPTFWCVVRGDMSLVGPRPLPVRYLARYSPEQARRHEVRPGITGLAQVSGRNAITWEQKFRLDVMYVDHHTFAGDLAVLMRTPFAVLKQSGAAPRGSATMPEFGGSYTVGDAP